LQEAETLYIPGLTYLELLTYSARLRDASAGPSYQTVNGPASAKSSAAVYESLKVNRSTTRDSGYEGSVFTIGTSSEVGTPLEIRVKQVMELLDLESCENKFIPERPSLRGSEGGDIRRLSIALEMVSLPDVLVLEDPTLGLDPAEGLKVMSRLQPIADRGITVICTLPKPNPQVGPLCFNSFFLLTYLILSPFYVGLCYARPCCASC
jgi:Fe-S cluster assembly ATPase SufC